jgi:hypothetical protein
MKHGKVRMIFVVLSLSFLFKVDCGFIINIHGKLEIILCQEDNKLHSKK